MLHCPTCGRGYGEGLTNCPEDNSLLQADATVEGAPHEDPLIGRTLDDKYLLESKLGVGGMGTVYRARHLLIDRAVAVKVLNPRFVEDEAAKARFRREAKAAGRLQHANAVGVTDFGQTSDGYVYIVMELLEGKTLREVLSKEAPLEVARAVSIMLQISSAVAAAHEAGIIHRDLKPANIFVAQRADAPASIKVLDFGIAKLAAESLDDDDRQTLTLVGAMIGTPRYMSPEQCNGEPLTPAADVYGLGVILYEMLTGTVPFSGASAIAIAMKHSTEQPRTLRAFVASIPEPLEAVVLHALEKDPANRPRDAATFRQELYEVAERLGLEHASAPAPSIEALRSAGTESPSGRLIIDLGRLRENRAATSSGSGELTKISDDQAKQIVESQAQNSTVTITASTAERPEHARVNVLLPKGGSSSARRTPRPVIFLTLFALALVVGAFWATRSNNPVPLATPVASPSPSIEDPSPTPSPVREVNKNRPEDKKSDNKNDNQNDNTPSGVKSVLHKGKKLIKKIF